MRDKMSGLRDFLRLILVSGLLWLGTLVPGLAADQKPAVVLILDYSRSMWGQIDGVNKVVILNDVLKEAFRHYQGRINLGVIAYGHRQSSGCTDIETVQSLRFLDAPRITEKIENFRPKGATPIAAALEQAASLSKNNPSGVHIILISDGLDNCKGDPCAVSGNLPDSSAITKIHTIAFDRKEKEELRALRCISEPSKGLFVSATNKGELRQALQNAIDISLNVTSALPPSNATLLPIEKKVKLEVREVKEKVWAAEDGASSWRPRTNISKSLPSKRKENRDLLAGLEKKSQSSAGRGEKTHRSQTGEKVTSFIPVSFKALISEGGRQIKSGLIWRIFDAKPKTNGDHLLLSTHRGATPTAALLPGEYLINAAYGRAHLTKKIQVLPGQSLNETFVLNCGGLRLSAVLPSGEKVPDTHLNSTIYSDERDQFSNRNKVINGAKSGLIIRLNAGLYRVVSRYGKANAKIEVDVTIEPGKLTEATIIHTAAKITFKLVLKPGGEALANTRWSILSAAGDVIKESAGALPTHILAAGKYTVFARHGDHHYKHEFDVKSGTAKQVEVVIE